MLAVGDIVQLALNGETVLPGSMGHLKPEYRGFKVQGVVKYITQNNANCGVQLEYECVRGYNNEGDPTNQGNAYGKGKNNYCVYVRVAHLTKIIETPPTPEYSVKVHTEHQDRLKALEFAKRYGSSGKLMMAIDPAPGYLDFADLYKQSGFLIMDHFDMTQQFIPNYIASVDDETAIPIHRINELVSESKRLISYRATALQEHLMFIKPRRVGLSPMYDSLKSQAYWERPVVSNSLSQNAIAQRGSDYHKEIQKYFEDCKVNYKGETIHQILGLVPETSIAVQDEEVLLCL